MKTPRTLATLSILTLALVGCGQTQADQEPTAQDPTATVTEAEQQPEADIMAEDPTSDIEYTMNQEYFFYGKTPSVIGKFDFPSEPIPEIEELREQADAPEVTYVTITVDNRQGQEGQRVQALSAFDEAGQQYEFAPISEKIDEWGGAFYDSETGEYADEDAHREATELHNEYLHGADAGEIKQIILAHEGTDLPEELTRIAVYTSGLGSEPVAALPTDHPEAEHADLDFEAPTN